MNAARFPLPCDTHAGSPAGLVLGVCAAGSLAAALALSLLLPRGCRA
jgi:hypothetical protein